MKSRKRGGDKKETNNKKTTKTEAVKCHLSETRAPGGRMDHQLTPTVVHWPLVGLMSQRNVIESHLA